MDSAWRSAPELLLQKRIAERPRHAWDVHTKLAHFSLITYSIPAERLRRQIPESRFELFTYTVSGKSFALLSAVPFLDVDFHFRKTPFAKFQFGQTNHRAYVVDKKTGEPAAWFFGTTLGSPLAYLASSVWKIPWHRARYRLDCAYDTKAARYSRYRFDVQSSWCAAQIDIEDTGENVGKLEGFQNQAEMELVLTHPVAGYFFRTDGKLGTYRIWHPRMELTVGKARNLCFSLYERLGLLSREEMAQPHSILCTPEIAFEVHLPPRLA